MNTPNKLTVLRMILIPFYLLFMYLPLEHGILIANIIFIAASITDALDGYIARRDGLVTDFGKLMDPLADKLLVMAAMVVLVDLGYVPAWAVVAILAREFLVSLLRQAAAASGSVIAADKLGKYKTVSQMAWIIIAMILAGGVKWAWLVAVSTGLCYIVVALTLVSGFNYILKNRQFFKQ